MHISTDILNYQTAQQRKLCSLFLPCTSLQNIVKNSTSLLHYRKLRAREMEFNEMKKNFLHLTKALHSLEEVKSVYEDYDLLISGSDQIWNGELNGFAKGGQEPYFLKDCPKKKISYATSLGPKDTPAIRQTIQHNLDSISAYTSISVREVFAKNLLQSYVKQPVHTVVDPIFLLDKEDYQVLFHDHLTPKQKYILLYTVNFDSGLLRKAAELSKKLNLPVVVPFSGHRAVYCKKYGFRILYDVGPGCFLDLLDKAEYIITNSFHGTAFSVHFKKPFFCYQASEYGVPQKDDRLHTLLEHAELTHRMISEDSDWDVSNTASSSEHSNLESEIAFSKNWLQHAIEN